MLRLGWGNRRTGGEGEESKERLIFARRSGTRRTWIATPPREGRAGDGGTGRDRGNGDEEHKGTRATGVQTAEGCLTDRGVASEGIRKRGNDVRWGSVFQSLFRTCWNWIPSQRCSMTMTGREQACLRDVSLSSLSLIREVELRVLLWKRDVGGGMFSGQTGLGAANRHKK